MKAFLTLLIFLTFTTSWAQETKRKKYKNESPPYMETYYVLKNNENIKHGQYHKSYRGLSVKGQFDNGNKVGVWEYTGNDGQVEQRIDFSNNKMTILKSVEVSEKYWINDGGTYKEVKPDEPPLFKDGRSWFYYYIRTMLRYPPEGINNGIEGVVYISAIITKDGQMIDEKVEEGPGYGLNEEALKVFLLIPDDWIPAKINGEKVDVKIKIPVSFKFM